MIRFGLAGKYRDTLHNNEDRICKWLYDKLPVPLRIKRIVIHLFQFLFFTFFVSLPMFGIIVLIGFLVNALIERIYPYVAQSPAWVLNFSSAAFAAISILVFFYFLSTIKIYSIEEREPAIGSVIEDNLERKIRGLMTSLEYVTKSINEIKDEIESRKKLANELQKDIEVGKLTKPQVDAVKRSMHEIFRKESNKSLVQNLLMGIIFFILGVIATKYMV